LTIPHHVPEVLRPDIKNSEETEDPRRIEDAKRVAHKTMVEAAHALAEKKGYLWPNPQVRYHKEQVGEMVVRHNIGLGKVDDQLDKVNHHIAALQKAKDNNERKSKAFEKHLAHVKEVEDEEEAWKKMKGVATQKVMADEKVKQEMASKAEEETTAKVNAEENKEHEAKKEAAEASAQSMAKVKVSPSKSPSKERMFRREVFTMDAGQ